MATTYKQLLIERAPPWLRNPQGQAWLRAVGDQLDALLEATKDSVKARFPLLGPADAVELEGGSRGIVHTPGETAEQYADRVAGAWDAWPWAGTALGVLNVLWDAGYQTTGSTAGPVVAIQKGLTYTLDANRELVIDTAPAAFTFTPVGHWASFIVVFPEPHIASWSPPPVHGSDEAKFIISLIQRWKSAHSRLQAVIVEGAGEAWGWPPDGLWSDPGTWGSSWGYWTP